jgi:cytochrome c oxidase cbb3-type subunit 2
MAGSIYRKPIIFTLVATLAILAGSVVTMFFPMLTSQMHPKLENLKPFTALQLAGRDIYQREGCSYCHTQTVRPLKAEVMRYGEYSKAGEFAYDHPFLWGSKRTGPDLARIGGKYPDAWHYSHFENPQAFFAQSNMPAYKFLKDNRLDPAVAEAHIKALGFPYTPDEIKALNDKTEMDALVAYMQVTGTAVARKVAPSGATKAEEKNPLAGDARAIHDGKEIYEKDCKVCHGDDGKGGIGPSLIDSEWLKKPGEISDGQIYVIIADGTEGGMPPYGGQMDKNKIWSLVSYIRSLQGK